MASLPQNDGSVNTDQVAGGVVRAALGYIAAGLSVVPVDPSTKRPVVRWAEYQQHIASADAVRSWSAAGVALVCGAVSGTLECVDFDLRGADDATFAAWCDDLQAARPGLLDVLCIQQTPSGGRHVIYRYDADDGQQQGNSALAWWHGPHRRTGEIGWHALIETRGAGGYFVVAPSPGWRVVQGDLCAPPVLSADDRALLLDLARGFDEREILPARAAGVAPVHQGGGAGDLERVTLALASLSDWRADDYGEWVRVGQALHSWDQGGGLPLWEDFSRRSTKFVVGECGRKWSGFGGYTNGKRPVTVASVFHAADEDAPDWWRGLAKYQTRAARPVAEPPPWLGGGAVEVPYLPGDAVPVVSSSSDGAPGAVPGDGDRAGRLRLIPAAELGNLPRPDWLIRDQVLRGGFGVLFGASGSGKSFLAEDHALQVAQSANVVYIAAEGAHGYAARVMAWCKHRKLGVGGLHFWIEAVNLLDTGAVAEFIETVRPLAPALIVIDTLARCLVGGDENSARDMGLAVAAVDVIRRETGAAVELVHHTTKQGNTERGSGALRGAADLMIGLNNSDGLIKVMCDKAKDSAPFEAYNLRLLVLETGRLNDDGTAETSCVLVPADQVIPSGGVSARCRQVLECLAMDIFRDHGAPSKDIETQTGMAHSSVFNALNTLVRGGYARQGAKREPYFITEKGLAVVNIERVPLENA